MPQSGVQYFPVDFPSFLEQPVHEPSGVMPRGLTRVRLHGGPGLVGDAFGLLEKKLSCRDNLGKPMGAGGAPGAQDHLIPESSGKPDSVMDPDNWRRRESFSKAFSKWEHHRGLQGLKCKVKSGGQWSGVRRSASRAPIALGVKKRKNLWAESE